MADIPASALKHARKQSLDDEEAETPTRLANGIEIAERNGFVRRRFEQDVLRACPSQPCRLLQPRVPADPPLLILLRRHAAIDEGLMQAEDDEEGGDGKVRELKGGAGAKTIARTEAKVKREWSSKIVQHLTVFVALTFMHALALLVFKLCAVDHKYPFSPASALVCTEATKLVLATCLHSREIQSMPEEGRPSGIFDSFRKTASLKVWVATAVVALLYAVNNLLSFFLVAQTDPGTLAIAKATVPYLCAILLRVLGRPLSDIQWCCIILQCTGVAITQYHTAPPQPAAPPAAGGDVNATSIARMLAEAVGADEATSGARYKPEMYAVLVLAIIVTAVTSVFNE